MQPSEIDVSLDELENRLDRLRALYEQYFLGIEKIEPAIARKDVDRRFWMLRKIQIRNTARRFRLQVLVQRYNTFQQYWTRICREIENGTYTRHLLKAQKNQGAEPLTWAARKRLGRRRAAGASEPPAEGAPSEGPGAALDELLPGEGVEATEAEQAAAAALEGIDVAGRPEAAAPARPARKVHVLEDLGPLDLDFDDEMPAAAPKPAAPKPAAPKPAAPRPAAPLAASNGNGLAPRPPAQAAPAVARPASTPVLARPAPAPGQAVPAARPAAAAAAQPASAPTRPNPAPAGSPGLTDARLRELHAELVATRRKLNQADNVSLDSLARTLRETEAKLRAQHGARSVEFQVTVKDGKPVVKPLVRK